MDSSRSEEEPTTDDNVSGRSSGFVTAQSTPSKRGCRLEPNFFYIRSWGFDPGGPVVNEGYALFPFAVDAEGFIPTVVSQDVSLTHTMSDGQPAGCLDALYWGNPSGGPQGVAFWEWTGTWEDLGVAAGSTVTNVTLTSVDVRNVSGGMGSGSDMGPFEIRDGTGALMVTLKNSYPSGFDSEPWVSTSGDQKSVPPGISSSDAVIKIRLNMRIDSTGGNIRVDNLKIGWTSESEAGVSSKSFTFPIGTGDGFVPVISEGTINTLSSTTQGYLYGTRAGTDMMDIGRGYFDWNGTWESLNVPIGSTLSTVEIVSVDVRNAAGGDVNRNYIGPIEIRDSAGAIKVTLLGRASYGFQASEWQTVQGDPKNVPSEIGASNTNIIIRVHMDFDAATNSTLMVDNLKIKCTFA